MTVDSNCFFCFFCTACFVLIVTASENRSTFSSGSKQEDQNELSSWSPWAAWTGCSSSCGTGIQLRQRMCLIRLAAHESRTTSSLDTSLNCVGEGKEYKICTLEPCSSAHIDARSTQCAAMGKKLPYPDNLYRWAAFFNESADPCALLCQAEDQHSFPRVRQLSSVVPDATPCGGGTDNLCLQGRCVPVGCDGRLFSLAFLDQCGICDGDGSTCKRVRGAYNSQTTTAGFHTIVRIAEGAADLKIQLDASNSTNLVLQNRHGGLILSGLSRHISALGVQRLVGHVMWRYRRLTYDEPTVVTTSQKLEDDLDVKVLVKHNGSAVSVSYEYTVPVPTGDLATSKSRPRFYWKDITTVPTIESTASTQEDFFEGHYLQESHSPSPLPRVVEEEPAVIRQLWQTSYDNEDWQPVRMNLEYDDDEASEEVQSPVSRGKKENGVDLSKMANEETDAASSEVGLFQSHYNPPWESIGTGLEPGVTFSWKSFGPIHCSATCSPGRVFEYAHCERSDGVLVNDSYCLAKAKPVPEPTECAGKLCDARWVAGQWSECSVSCGSGVQQRFVRCWRVLARGLDSTVHPYMCEETQRPLDTRDCDRGSCQPQWHVAPWAKCSAVCGPGIETRAVRCVTSADGTSCPEDIRPPDSRSCFLQPCLSGVWVAEDWSQCSGLCGTGIRFRSVHCRNVRGQSLDDGQCTASKKPLSREPCSMDASNCSTHWVPQEWTKCSVECGIGNQRREVLCAGLKSGRVRIYKDRKCRRLPKPPSLQSCRSTKQCRKQWFASPWSQCSASCDNGVRMREVVCEGVEGGLPCDLQTRPVDREACSLPPCPTMKPSELEETKCVDFPTTKCELVIKVRLCEHWFYKKACCESCLRSRLNL